MASLGLNEFRARRLFFPQLDSRTTIKKYGLVRNRNLLGHNENILFFAFVMKNEQIENNFNHPYVIFFFHNYCVWSTLLENKSLVLLSTSGIAYFWQFWCHMGQEYISNGLICMKTKHFNIEFLKRRTYSLYPAHAMSLLYVYRKPLLYPTSTAGRGRGYTGFTLCVIRPPVRPSVDEIVSVLHLPQY